MDAIKTQALPELEARYTDYRQVALRIWGFAEVGFKEPLSSALLQKPVPGRDAGHGCGHNLVGTASVAAGIGLKNSSKKANSRVP